MYNNDGHKMVFLKGMNGSVSKVAVIYRSKYGTTEAYARWIAGALDADLLTPDSIEPNMLPAYDTVIYGGGMYAGGVLGFSAFIKKHYPAICDKHLVLFGVGASLDPKLALESIQKHNLSEEMYWKIKTFFFRGGLSYDKMGKLDRLMMFMLKKMIASKKLQDDDSLGIVATYGKNVDFTDQNAIAPLVAYIHAIRK